MEKEGILKNFFSFFYYLLLTNRESGMRNGLLFVNKFYGMNEHLSLWNERERKKMEICSQMRVPFAILATNSVLFLSQSLVK